MRRCARHRTLRRSPPDRPAQNRRRCAAGPLQRSGSCAPPRRSPPAPRQNPPEHGRDRAEAHEYFAMPQTARQHVVLNNGDPATVAVLVAKPLKNPLRGMPLLPRPALIRRQDTVDDPGERVELRTRRRSAPPIPGRYGKRQHLGYCPRVNAKLPRRFPAAQTLDLYRVTNPPIKLNHLHPPPSAITPKGYLLPEFYSGATGLTGRFNEGFLLRRLQPDWPRARISAPAGSEIERIGQRLLV